MEKIPEYVRKQLIFHPVTTMEEVLFLSLEEPEKFFKDRQKTEKLNEQWKDTVRESVISDMSNELLTKHNYS